MGGDGGEGGNGETFILGALRRPRSFIALFLRRSIRRVNSCPRPNELTKQKRTRAIKCRAHAPFLVDILFVWGVRARYADSMQIGITAFARRARERIRRRGVSRRQRESCGLPIASRVRPRASDVDTHFPKFPAKLRSAITDLGSLLVSRLSA